MSNDLPSPPSSAVHHGTTSNYKFITPGCHRDRLIPGTRSSIAKLQKRTDQHARRHEAFKHRVNSVTSPSSKHRIVSMMDPIRVLVTGGCGFLGTSIISALLPTKRYAITAIDINPPSLGSTTFTADVRYVRCDVLDSPSLSKVFAEARPAIVIHTVGVYPLGAKRYSMKGKEAVFKVNVEGTRNVLEASRGCGAKSLVYTSSVTVVLDKLDQDFRNVDERWPAGDVDTSYGLSKVCSSCSLLALTYNRYCGCCGIFLSSRRCLIFILSRDLRRFKHCIVVRASRCSLKHLYVPRN
jgi:dTDP-4-dehydrorhamnose reductase